MGLRFGSMKGKYMRVGIDVSQAVYGTGVGDYTINLVRWLVHLDKEDEFILFGGALRRRQELTHLFPNTQNCTLKTFLFPPIVANIFWNDLHKLPIEKFIGNVDIFHSSDWAQPPTSAFKITTIHDLASLRLPQYTPKKVIEAHSKRLKWIAREVDKIIAVSSFTKQEAVELLEIDPERIVVIPEAADERIQKKEASVVQKTKDKFDINGKYILMVGTNPRKNLNRIIQAFEHSKQVVDTLVVVGDKPKEATLGGQNIVYTGFTNFEDLSALYSGAEVLVYASLYEGFGQPILEAMKIGVPVVTSNISSMPEVAGDAAVLVDPLKVESIAAGVSQACRSKEWWVKKGLARVKEFSWEDTAKLTLRVYKEASSS